jgi:hypothetical protein
VEAFGEPEVKKKKHKKLKGPNPLSVKSKKRSALRLDFSDGGSSVIALKAIYKIGTPALLLNQSFNV